MPRNVVDEVLEGGGTVAGAAGRGGVASCSVVVDGGAGGGVGEGRKLDSTMCCLKEGHCVSKNVHGISLTSRRSMRSFSRVSMRPIERNRSLISCCSKT